MVRVMVVVVVVVKLRRYLAVGESRGLYLRCGNDIIWPREEAGEGAVGV